MLGISSATSATKSALVLFERDPNGLSRGEVIARAIADHGVDVTATEPENLRQITSGAWQIRDGADGEWKKFQLPRAGLNYMGAEPGVPHQEFSAKLAALEKSGVKMVHGAEPWRILTDKFAFAKHFGDLAIQSTKVQSLDHVAQLLQAAHARGEEGVVVKGSIGTEGEAVSIIRNQADLDELAKTGLPVEPIAQKPEDGTIGEHWEPELLASMRSSVRVTNPELRHASDGDIDKTLMGHRADMRVITVLMPDGSVDARTDLVRVAGGGQFLTNMAQGAAGLKFSFEDLHPADQKTIIAAAKKAPAGARIVGWDLIGQPGKRKLIEGNSGSGFPGEITGFDRTEIARPMATLMAHMATKEASVGQRLLGSTPGKIALGGAAGYGVHELTDRNQNR